MLESYVPDVYKKSIYEIDYLKLKNEGIKCIIFDLFNTLVSFSEKEPSNTLKLFIEELKNMGFKVIIMSNQSKEKIEKFRNTLEVDACFLANKPRREKYDKIMNIYNLLPEDIASIGDELYIDVRGANRLGIKSILVNSIAQTKEEQKFTDRVKENIISFLLTKRELFVRGRYYE
ncbi:MAG: YqeG family HAD IIIA-type phosphatase [Bacilli bacterium]